MRRSRGRGWPSTRDDPGAEIVVDGTGRVAAAPQDAPEEGWPTEAQQHWDPAVTAGPRRRSSTVPTSRRTPSTPARRSSVRRSTAGRTRASRASKRKHRQTAAQPQWFRELNLDPRHRIVAGLGTRVVQTDQEDLMLSAWNQVVGVEAANRALRLAQLGQARRRIAASPPSRAIHRRGGRVGDRARARQGPRRAAAQRLGDDRRIEPAHWR